MKFNNTSLGTIKKRYKRFLADITLDSGEEITAHVPNTGSMTTCWAPGWKVLLTKSDNPKRKLPYTLEMTNNGLTWIGVNTSLTNKIVNEALEQNVIKEITNYIKIKPEEKYGDSRIDFCLTSKDGMKTYIEVKNVTLKGSCSRALFPDSVTVRGQKHLKELMKIKSEGHNAIMLFLINREDTLNFSPAKDIDPIYSTLLEEAQEKGVKILAYNCSISETSIKLKNSVKIIL